MPQPKLNQRIRDEIARIAEIYDTDPKVLQAFAEFVIQNHKQKDKAPAKPSKPPKPLTLTQLKKAVYQYFEVKDTPELKRSGRFKMATDGMDELNFSVKETWEALYRKFVGILPGEDNQNGYGCINGINIFNYFQPWQVFGLDPKTATPEDIKKAYHNLSKIYHPDVPSTGDSQVFDRLNTMYKSISAGA
jgi:hypothetical protein